MELCEVLCWRWILRWVDSLFFTFNTAEDIYTGREEVCRDDIKMRNCSRWVRSVEEKTVVLRISNLAHSLALFWLVVPGVYI